MIHDDMLRRVVFFFFLFSLIRGAANDLAAFDCFTVRRARSSSCSASIPHTNDVFLLLCEVTTPDLRMFSTNWWNTSRNRTH